MGAVFEELDQKPGVLWPRGRTKAKKTLEAGQERQVVTLSDCGCAQSPSNLEVEIGAPGVHQEDGLDPGQ